MSKSLFYKSLSVLKKDAENMDSFLQNSELITSWEGFEYLPEQMHELLLSPSTVEYYKGDILNAIAYVIAKTNMSIINDEQKRLLEKVFSGYDIDDWINSAKTNLNSEENIKVPVNVTLIIQMLMNQVLTDDEDLTKEYWDVLLKEENELINLVSKKATMPIEYIENSEMCNFQAMEHNRERVLSLECFFGIILKAFFDMNLLLPIEDKLKIIDALNEYRTSMLTAIINNLYGKLWICRF